MAGGWRGAIEETGGGKGRRRKMLRKKVLVYKLAGSGMPASMPHGVGGGVNWTNDEQCREPPNQ